jgi:hypothetical protein
MEARQGWTRATVAVMLFVATMVPVVAFAPTNHNGAFTTHVVVTRSANIPLPRSSITALFYGTSADESAEFLKATQAASGMDSASSVPPKKKIIEYPDFLPNPNPVLTAVDVVAACMDTLLERKDAGLEVCFHFSSDRCRAAIGGSLDEFAAYAHNPTFAYLINCRSWDVCSVGPIIPGTLHRGSMQTVLMVAKAASATAVASQNSEPRAIGQTDKMDKENNNKANDDDKSRRFLWTLQQERRPPLQGCWMIHEVLYTKNAWQQTL